MWDLLHETRFWRDSEPTFFPGTSQDSYMAGRVVTLFQSLGINDDIGRRAEACARNFWNQPTSFEAQEIFCAYARWSLQPCTYSIVSLFLAFRCRANTESA